MSGGQMNNSKTVGFATLGCRLNQVESQEMRALVEQAGFRAVEEGEAANVYVVNTCTVTSRADFSDRQAIRRITRANPDALIVVTGCLAQTNPEALARMPGVDLVLATRRNTGCPRCSTPSSSGTGRRCGSGRSPMPARWLGRPSIG
jgi:tRNA A37 methylthiotransferase MiaB